MGRKFDDREVLAASVLQSVSKRSASLGGSWAVMGEPTKRVWYGKARKLILALESIGLTITHVDEESAPVANETIVGAVVVGEDE